MSFHKELWRSDYCQVSLARMASSWTTVDINKAYGKELEKKWKNTKSLDVQNIFDDNEHIPHQVKNEIEHRSKELDQENEIYMSQYRPKKVDHISDVFPIVLDKVMDFNRALSIEEWDDISRLFQVHENVFRHWPTRFMKVLASTSKEAQGLNVYPIAQSLMDYSKGHEFGMSITMVALFMTICCRIADDERQDITYRLLAEVKERTDVYDSQIGLWVVEALCYTDRWKESYDIIKDVEMVSDNSTEHWGYIGAAAFR